MLGLGNMKLKKIDNVMFRVKDLEKAAEFYEKEMGLKKVWEDKNEGMIGFIFPNSDSEIKKSSERTLGCSGMRISMSIPDIVIHNNKMMPNPDFNFLVDNVDEFLKSFKGKVSMRMEIRSGKLAVLEDLDGNKIPIVDLTKFGNKAKYDKK